MTTSMTVPSTHQQPLLSQFGNPDRLGDAQRHGCVGRRSLQRFVAMKLHFSQRILGFSCANESEEQGETPLACRRPSGSGLGRRSLLASLPYVGVVSTGSSLAASEKKRENNKGKKSLFDEQRLLEQNRRMQELNEAPDDFPGFVREGYNVKIVTSDRYVKCNSGLIYLDIQDGQGDSPKSGQQVLFHYIGYNESGRRVDSTYQQGRPARSRVGINAMIPGFEEGIRTMKPGGKRRIIVPPELGPPVGPSTFFSAKQFEVFDVELLEASDCKRRTIGFYSDVVCE